MNSGWPRSRWRSLALRWRRTLAAGEPQQVLPTLVKAQAPALLVMGAFGHSRLRQWFMDSATTTRLRLSDVPVLILR